MSKETLELHLLCSPPRKQVYSRCLTNFMNWNLIMNFKQFTSKKFEANRLIICCLKRGIFLPANLLICCLFTGKFADLITEKG